MQPAMGPPPLETTATSRLRTWRWPGLASQLQAGLVQHPVPVHATRRQLTPVGVEGELTVERDAGAALDERPRLAVTAEPERLEPRQGQEREPVVELGDVHVGRLEIGAAPHFGGGVGRCHLGVVGPLVPAPEPERPATGLDPNGVVAVGWRHRPSRRRRRRNRRRARRSPRVRTDPRSCGPRGSRPWRAGPGRSPRGFNAALLRLLMANQPSCSLVVP